MSRIALIGKGTSEFVSRLIDIWNNGDCAVLIDWQTPIHKAFDMMKEAGVLKCYIQTNIWSENADIIVNNIEIIFFEACSDLTILLPDYIYSKFHVNYSKTEAVIIYSSGTTGKSKGIILSHFAINTNADAIIDYMCPSASDDCIYTIRSLSHSSTLTGELLVALKSHVRLVINTSAVPPRYILKTIKLQHVSILCLNPTILSLLCDEAIRKAYDISSLKKVYVSGDVLSDKVYKKAHNTFSEISVYNVYGLSEAAPRVAAQTVEYCKTNSVGKPIDGIEIAIVNENGIPVPDGNRGVIHVNTPSLFSGYVTGNIKHCSLYCGWLNTGDIGYKDKYGELHVVGRIDDIIICEAHKVYPIDVEKLIMDNPAITDCAVSKCLYNGLEVIGCLYVSDEDCAIEIVHRLKNMLMQYEIPKKFLMIESIPHNDRGKIDYKKVSDILSRDSTERVMNYGKEQNQSQIDRYT